MIFLRFDETLRIVIFAYRCIRVLSRMHRKLSKTFRQVQTNLSQTLKFIKKLRKWDTSNDSAQLYLMTFETTRKDFQFQFFFSFQFISKLNTLFRLETSIVVQAQCKEP